MADFTKTTSVIKKKKKKKNITWYAFQATAEFQSGEKKKKAIQLMI